MLDLLPYLACGTRPFVVRDYFDLHVCVVVLGWSVVSGVRVWAFTFGAALKCIFPLDLCTLRLIPIYTPSQP